MSNENDLFDVFLSHAHPDAAAVEFIGAKLEDEAQLRVWLDRWILIPGERWQQEMATGLRQSKTCAVCIGRHTPEGWFREEIERALNRQVQDKSFRVIPIILPDGDPKLVDNFLELRTWVDFKNGLNDRYAFHVLSSGIKGIPPGRNPYEKTSQDTRLEYASEDLLRIRVFREQKLIDDDVALDYQRRILEELLKR